MTLSQMWPWHDRAVSIIGTQNDVFHTTDIQWVFVEWMNNKTEANYETKKYCIRTIKV